LVAGGHVRGNVRAFVVKEGRNWREAHVGGEGLVFLCEHGRKGTKCFCWDDDTSVLVLRDDGVHGGRRSSDAFGALAEAFGILSLGVAEVEDDAHGVLSENAGSVVLEGNLAVESVAGRSDDGWSRSRAVGVHGTIRRHVGISTRGHVR
jgi:hypothetical protein